MVRPPGQIEVGRFADHAQYSDVALLGDDYVVATHVWDAGMGILRDDGP
jgi:hypothetical protein